MRRNITIAAVLVLLAITYWVGRRSGTRVAFERQLEEDTERCRRLAELDRSFLGSLAPRTGGLTS